MTKKGLRDFDSRAAVLSLTASRPSEGGAVSTWCCATLEPAVRPDDVLSGLAAVAGLELVGVPLLTRLAQGPLDPDDRRDRRPAASVK